MAAPSSYSASCGSEASDTFDATGSGIFYRNSKTRMADITNGASHTVMVGERAWAYAKGIWAGAISGGVIMRGDLNSNPGSPNSSAHRRDPGPVALPFDQYGKRCGRRIGRLFEPARQREAMIDDLRIRPDNARRRA